jgi:hypothetical protein
LQLLTLQILGLLEVLLAGLVLEVFQIQVHLERLALLIQEAVEAVVVILCLAAQAAPALLS